MPRDDETEIKALNPYVDETFHIKNLSPVYHSLGLAVLIIDRGSLLTYKKFFKEFLQESGILRPTQWFAPWTLLSNRMLRTESCFMIL